MSFPRLHSELSGQSETTSTTLADYRDYSAIASYSRTPLPFKAIVFKSGTTYYAKDEYGTLITSNSAFPTAAQAAINNLTAGRTWNESVWIQPGIYTGALAQTAQLYVPQYTDIFGYGVCFKLAYSQAAANTRLMQITGSYVNVYGITLDGNKDYNHTATGSGQGMNYFINGTSLSHINLVDSASKNARLNGFEIWAYSTTFSDVWLHRCKSINDGMNGISFAYGVQDSGAVNCYVTGTGDLGMNASGGGGLGTPTDVSFIDCIADTINGTSGSASYGSTNGHIGCRFESARRCHIKGGIIRAVEGGIFDDAASLGGHTVENVTVIMGVSDWNSAIQFQKDDALVQNCRIYLAGNQYGIRFLGDHSQAVGNYVSGSASDTGIYEDATATLCKYTRNRLYDVAGTKITLLGSGSSSYYNDTV
jgi:hypothetical protein